MKDMIFTCPKCGTKFSFLKQMSNLADENGTPIFDEKLGIDFHMILCPNCDSHWILTLSGVHDESEGYIDIDVK